MIRCGVFGLSSETRYCAAYLVVLELGCSCSKTSGKQLAAVCTQCLRNSQYKLASYSFYEAVIDTGVMLLTKTKHVVGSNRKQVDC